MNSYTHTRSLHTNAREKSHGHKLIVQTDHSHIQLGEKREQKIQLLHLRYPKLLFPPKPNFRMKTTMITYNPTLLCVHPVAVQFASTAHSSESKLESFSGCMLFPFKDTVYIKLKYFLGKKQLAENEFYFHCFNNFQLGFS